jgi:hypothetical protein
MAMMNNIALRKLKLGILTADHTGYRFWVIEQGTGNNIILINHAFACEYNCIRQYKFSNDTRATITNVLTQIPALSSASLNPIAAVVAPVGRPPASQRSAGGIDRREPVEAHPIHNLAAAMGSIGKALRSGDLAQFTKGSLGYVKRQKDPPLHTSKLFTPLPLK